MLIKLLQLVEKYKINFKGILHVGAHECEELGDYLKYLPMNNILWVEGLVDKVQYCKNKFPGIQIEHAVVSDIIESVTFNRANNGQSSSILEFGFGGKFDELFLEVHRSNMSKACNTQQEAIETLIHYKEKDGTEGYYKEVDGKWLVYRSGDNKVLKSISYSPANLKPIIYEESV